MKKLLLILIITVGKMLSADPTPSAPFIYSVGYSSGEIGADYIFVQLSITEPIAAPNLEVLSENINDARNQLQTTSQKLLGDLAGLKISSQDITVEPMETDGIPPSNISRNIQINFRNMNGYPDLLQVLDSYTDVHITSKQYCCTTAGDFGNQLEDQAVGDAKQKATRLASAAGLRIIGVYSIAPVVPDEISQQFMGAGRKKTNKYSAVAFETSESNGTNISFTCIVHIIFLVGPAGKSP
jgi:uncharacterized protein YggE